MNSQIESVTEILTLNFLYHKLNLKTYTCPAFDYSNVKYKFYANQPVSVTSNGDRTKSKHGNLYDNEVDAEQLKTPSSGIIRARLRQVSLVTVTLKIINSVSGSDRHRKFQYPKSESHKNVACAKAIFINIRIIKLCTLNILLFLKRCKD